MPATLPQRAHGFLARRPAQREHSRPAGPLLVGRGSVRPQSPQGTRATVSPWPMAVSAASKRTTQVGQSLLGRLRASGLSDR